MGKLMQVIMRMFRLAQSDDRVRYLSIISQKLDDSAESLKGRVQNLVGCLLNLSLSYGSFLLIWLHFLGKKGEDI